MITYEYNNEKKILEVTFADELRPSEIMTFMQNVNQDRTLPNKLNSLIDARTASYVFEPRDLQNVVKVNFHMDRRYEMINNAILTNNLNEPALMLFKQYTFGSENYHVELFKDEHAALCWLKSF